MAIDNGFIRVSKKILKWEWYTDVSTKALFFHLLLTANWKQAKWRGFVVERGQIITTRARLAKETGLTVQQVRTALTKLNSTNEVTHTTTNTYHIITVNNYEAYNPQGKISNQVSNQVSNQRTTNEQPTDNQRTTTIEEEEEEEEEKDKYLAGTDELKLSNLLLDLMTANNSKTKQPYIQTWCDEINKIHRIDGNSYDDIEALIRWTQNDSFWKTNILSPVKLRKQFAQLWLKKAQSMTSTIKSIEDNIKIIEAVRTKAKLKGEIK
jgi:hypothetical protein